MRQNQTCLKPCVASRFWRTLLPRTSHAHGWQPRSRERSLLPAVGLVAAGGRTSDAGIPRERFNQGGTADIHARAPGQVVKLFREGFPPQLGQQEARMTQAVFAAGAPAPEVFGEVTLDGRFGVVLGRLDGPTLLQSTRDGAVNFAEAGAILASLGLTVHRLSPPPEALHLRGWMTSHPGIGRQRARAHRLRRPRADRPPAAAWGRAVPWRHSPWKRDHDGGRSAADRLDLFDPRACGPRLWVH